jgi:hypothetical protein
MSVLFWDSGEKLLWYQSSTGVVPEYLQGTAGGRRVWDTAFAIPNAYAAPLRVREGERPREPRHRRKNAEWAGEATQSHLQATCKPFASHLQANRKPLPCVSHASPMRPSCVPQATPERRQNAECRRSLDAEVEQRRHEDAKAGNKAALAILAKSETFTWQVNPNPLPNLPFSSSFFASWRLCCSHPVAGFRMKNARRR